VRGERDRRVEPITRESKDHQGKTGTDISAVTLVRGVGTDEYTEPSIRSRSSSRI